MRMSSTSLSYTYYRLLLLFTVSQHVRFQLVDMYFDYYCFFVFVTRFLLFDSIFNRTSSYTNAQTTAATNYMMLGEPALAQSGYRGQIPQPKYPPPLIPVRHLNGGLRYDGPQYGQAMDAVDLSAAPKYVHLYLCLTYLLHIFVITIPGKFNVCE